MTKSLPQAGPISLGRPTIMDPGLAAQHGVPYVHLAAFAIDVDRIREHVEGYEDPRPFAWEVFLVEQYVVERFDPNRRPEQLLIFEDIVLGALEGAVDACGSQIVFSIWDLIQRGLLPKRLEGAFRGWEARPTELAKDLDPLFERAEEVRRELALSCLEVELAPPITPPTLEALEALGEVVDADGEIDAAASPEPDPEPDSGAEDAAD